MSKIYGRCIHSSLSSYAETILIIDTIIDKSCTVFIRSSPSFFKLTYMMLQKWLYK